MVDTGATGDFIDRDFVATSNLTTRKLSRPIPVYNVDGTPNEAGSISEVVDVLMTYNGHSERIVLAVTRLGKQSMILGFTWLDKHNPEIDFRAKTVKMTRCLPRCCSGCQTERKEEQTRKKEESRRINACRAGPFPAFVEDAEDELEPEPLPSPEPESEEPDEPLEDLGNGTFPPSRIHPSNDYNLSTSSGRFPTKLSTCGIQRTRPAVPSRLRLCLLQRFFRRTPGTQTMGPRRRVNFRCLPKGLQGLPSFCLGTKRT